jgi:hypothetical protein
MIPHNRGNHTNRKASGPPTDLMVLVEFREIGLFTIISKKVIIVIIYFGYNYPIIRGG